MAELIALAVMNRRHLLQAEAEVAKLSDEQLLAAGATPNSLDEVRHTLRQGRCF